MLRGRRLTRCADLLAVPVARLDVLAGLVDEERCGFAAPLYGAAAGVESIAFVTKGVSLMLPLVTAWPAALQRLIEPTALGSVYGSPDATAVVEATPRNPTAAEAAANASAARRRANFMSLLVNFRWPF